MPSHMLCNLQGFSLSSVTQLDSELFFSCYKLLQMIWGLYLLRKFIFKIMMTLIPRQESFWHLWLKKSNCGSKWNWNAKYDNDPCCTCNVAICLITKQAGDYCILFMEPSALRFEPQGCQLLNAFPERFEMTAFQRGKKWHCEDVGFSNIIFFQFGWRAVSSQNEATT